MRSSLLFLSFFLLLCHNSAFGQADSSRYHCVYKYTRACTTIGDKADTTQTLYCLLQIGSKMSKFIDYVAYRADSVCHSPQSTEDDKQLAIKEAYKQIAAFDPIIIRPLSAGGDMTVYDELVTERYRYTEPANTIHWAVGDPTDSIAGYPCYAATGEYAGNRWSVSFTPAIATDAGPWKLSGLPGLILRAQSVDGVHRFELISFRPIKSPIKLPEEKTIVPTTRKEFVARKNIYLQDPDAFMKEIPVEAFRNVVVLKDEGRIIVNGILLRQPSAVCASVEQ